MISEKDVDLLKNHAVILNDNCNILNKNLQLVSTLNHEISADFTKGVVKIQSFVLSDFIFIFSQVNLQKSTLANFYLAYFYDALKNLKFADVSELHALKDLLVEPNFEQTINHIKLTYKLLPNDLKKRGFFGFEIIKTQPNLFESYKVFFNGVFGILLENKESLAKQLDIKLSTASTTTAVAEHDTLEKTLAELNQLIGLKDIKKAVNDLVNYLKVQNIRSVEGLKLVEITLHSVFYGPPGTGKTTVARLLGRIFKHLGVLSKGQLIETDREGLVAGYVGQTAIKVNEIADQSMGGVLFIDEAYALTQNFSGNDFGSEAVSTLLKRMEDDREDLAVIVAGYSEPMNTFINSNPGLKSRFNRYYNFVHFKPQELMEIFELNCKNSDFELAEGAKEKLIETFEMLYEKKDETFGNARLVRNLFEVCIQNQANRLVAIKKHSKKTLKILLEEDIPEPTQTLKILKDFK
jgi:stage V sporulation protein K